MLELAFRVRVETAHPDLADAVDPESNLSGRTLNPGRDVSINPNKNSILTPQRPVPDVRLGYASTGQGGKRFASSTAAPSFGFMHSASPIQGANCM